MVVLAGLALGAAGAAAWAAYGRKRRLDPRIVRALPRARDPPMVVFVPGLLGSQLLRPDGSVAWLNLGNTLGHHDLSLPRQLPFARRRDELHPGFLIGTDSALPRAFGFTEYADLLDLLDAAGYEPGIGPGLRYAVYTYDWRRDLVEAARGLALRLEGLAREMGDPGARFHLVGHSMGGLVVRWYLRYGGAEPYEDAPVTWAGARRVASVVLTATPNAGSIPALGAILSGERVGLSYTTLAAVGREPDALGLPAAAARGHAAAGRRARRALDRDLHDPDDLGALRLGAVRPASDDASRPSARSWWRRSSGRARSTPGSRACPRPVPGARARARRRLPAHAGAGGGRRGPARARPRASTPAPAASRTCCSRPATAA